MATLAELQSSKTGKLTLDQLRQKAGIQTSPQPQGILGKANQLSQQFNRGVEDVGTGALKGLGSTLFGIGKLGEKIVISGRVAELHYKNLLGGFLFIKYGATTYFREIIICVYNVKI